MDTVDKSDDVQATDDKIEVDVKSGDTFSELAKEVKALREAAESADARAKETSEYKEKTDAMTSEIEALRKQLTRETKTARQGEFEVTDSDVNIPSYTGKQLDRLFTLKAQAGSDVERMQEGNDMLYIANTILGGNAMKHAEVANYVSEEYPELAKAMDTGDSTQDVTTSTGWIPTGFSASMVEAVRLQLNVANLHGRFNMPTNPYKLPIEGADISAYVVSEATTDVADHSEYVTAQTSTTANVVFNAKKLGVRTVVSTEMTEDSIVPVLPYVRDKIALALAEGQENVLINGDIRTSGTTNLSGLTYASGGQLQAWDGYRRMAQISGTTTDLSGTFSLANLRKLRTAMGKYGVSTRNLAFVVGINAYHTLLDMTEVVTVDKIGSRATILDGQMGSIDGIPILISEFVSEDLDAVGETEGGGGGTTEILCVRTDAMRFGDRRGITLKSREQIETDQNVVVALQRLDFEAVQPTSDPIVSAGVGVALKA